MGDEMQLGNMTRGDAGSPRSSTVEARSSRLTTGGLRSSRPRLRSDCTNLCGTLRRALERRASLRRLGRLGSVLKGVRRRLRPRLLYELMAIADPLTPEEREPAMHWDRLTPGALAGVTGSRLISCATRATTWNGFCDDTVAFRVVCGGTERR